MQKAIIKLVFLIIFISTVLQRSITILIIKSNVIFNHLKSLLLQNKYKIISSDIDTNYLFKKRMKRLQIIVSTNIVNTVLFLSIEAENEDEHYNMLIIIIQYMLFL